MGPPWASFRISLRTPHKTIQQSWFSCHTSSSLVGMPFSSHGHTAVTAARHVGVLTWELKLRVRPERGHLIKTKPKLILLSFVAGTSGSELACTCVFVCLRIFIMCFSEEMGGRRSLETWKRVCQEIQNYRSINPPLPIVGGVFTQDAIERWARRISAYIEVREVPLSLALNSN
jgi:hypothetical protein